MQIKTLITGAALSLFAGLAIAAPAGLSMSDAGVLVDGKGMTLYTFDKDAPGVSNCYGGCAGSWPPFVAKSGADADGDFTLVERKDGSAQWAYKGMPLYYWAGDSKPGDTKGDGVGGVWHAVK
jgi:predicted lipoprotein with Yx(FWY)xxD motif